MRAPATVAALIAVSLLLFAGVKSALMQAEAVIPAAASACPDMPGMTMPAGSHPKGKPAPCVFCDVAGHLPVAAAPPGLAAPIGVAWAISPLLPDPSEPLRFLHRPRARGPPHPPRVV